MRKKRIPGNCSKCGIWRDGLHRDHIIPKFKGGTEDADNIQLLCANCHQDKSHLDVLGETLYFPSKEQRKKQSVSLSEYWKSEAGQQQKAKRATNNSTGFAGITKQGRYFIVMGPNHIYLGCCSSLDEAIALRSGIVLDGIK